MKVQPMQLYVTYPKENLLAVTAKIENMGDTVVGYGFLRFCKGVQNAGKRSYDTKDALVIKMTRFELATLAEALIAIGKREDKRYKKYADASRSPYTPDTGVKVLEVEKNYIQLCFGGRCIRLHLNSFEMIAMGRDLRTMVHIINERIWSGKS